ncbi:UDP-N-acetylmuramoyl-L-alanyl-D-glutamate--2,6-diaminopimelate ligase [Bacillus lacus]|uniref:UDP-N-acetylmuramoyl-L-alanyl-D-glutamate--2,6-diaminopimelate ligase n=1 Tax=Metabacillus lacus TaxID=1983721 RepID=A0A7X2IW15_9BACI|nr:UDP-N-acetylmuramoyl-L-alanyl-D-glutamate--2,6-diaminopimelate ligase [Metabacillus lacus]MRX70811.1 UDP-N-acetylmuramoyl-L-alanyl-D-glutamate--2,6-diaminopimelate ligase [Metabacillus lacus]
MKLNELLNLLPFYKCKNAEELNIDIQSIEMDSREVKDGSLFICIEGFTVDGHLFAAAAKDKGAAAILAERDIECDLPVIIVNDTKRAMAVLADAFYGQPSQKLHLIGITGTNGKTTTSHIVEQILKNHGKKTGLIGTMYIKIGENVSNVKNTTPDSLTLQKTFRRMLDEGVEGAVMEVSSHALHMGRVYGCDYDVAVFTNLTQDHLDYHKTMDSYRQAKGLLFSQLGNTFYHNKPKFAVLNNDDPASSQYKLMTAAHILTYGIDSSSDIMAEDIKMTASGTSFNLKTPAGTKKVEMKLIGKFSVYNVLAAAGAAAASGIPLDTIVEAIENLQAVRGRFEVVDAGQDFTVIVDYAHTPDSLENVLKTIRQFARSNVYAVVGCGGDRDRAKRPVMAEIAATYSDVPIFTSDNPRSENPEQILKDMEQGVMGKDYLKIISREQAIFAAIEKAEAGDVVLIAGKGHETYQIIGTEILDFDDREVAIRAISSVRSGGK